jgi:uncharacterized membrane protein YfcA
VTPLDLLELAGTGVVAGTVNTIAGAGSLLTFPVLIAVGLSPVAANVTNDIGVVPGNLTGTAALRAGLAGQRRLLRVIVPLTLAGSLAGAVLLILAPARAFEAAAPGLLLAASVLTAAQPRLARLAQRAGRERSGWLRVSVSAIALYGGYFGTGIGVLFIAVLGLFLNQDLSRLNAVKTLLQLLANAAAGVLFVFIAPVNWAAVLMLALGSTIGGPLGARLARFISARRLRQVICVAGIAASGYLFWQQF